MTAAVLLRTVDDMRRHIRRTRDHYLRRLAAEPLFEGLPRHLVAVVGRSVDPLEIASGCRAHCDPAREVVVIADGHAVLVDAVGRPRTLVGPCVVVARSGDDRSVEPLLISAISDVRAFVIARREIRAVAAIAPRIAEALSRADSPTDLPRRVPARAGRAGTLLPSRRP